MKWDICKYISINKVCIASITEHTHSGHPVAGLRSPASPAADTWIYSLFYGT